MPLKTRRLSVNQPFAGGNPQCIAVTTERVANSGSGFEFLCAALRKKALLQMRRDNLFLTEFQMKNRCSYFRISSLSKNSQPLSLSRSFDVSSHSCGAGFNGPQSQIFTSLNCAPLTLWEPPFLFYFSSLSSRSPLVIKNSEKAMLKSAKSEVTLSYFQKSHHPLLLLDAGLVRSDITGLQVYMNAVWACH